MIVLVLTGLAILPLLIITFGGLALKRLVRPKVFSVALVLSLVAVAVELFLFYEKAHTSIVLKQWMVVSNLMAAFPLYSTLTVLAMAFGVVLIFDFKNLSLVRVAVFGLIALVSLNLRTFGFQKTFAEFTKLNEMAFASLNEDSILNLLNDQNADLSQKIILAGRADLSSSVIEKLASDATEVLRFYAVQSPLISEQKLRQMLDSDPSKEIRKQAKIALKNRGLSVDSAAKE